MRKLRPSCWAITTTGFLRLEEAGEGGNAERWWFYDELARKADAERVQTDTEFAMVKERMFEDKAEARPLTIRYGKRVQQL